MRNDKGLTGFRKLDDMIGLGVKQGKAKLFLQLV